MLINTNFNGWKEDLSFLTFDHSEAKPSKMGISSFDKMLDSLSQIKMDEKNQDSPEFEKMNARQDEDSLVFPNKMNPEFKKESPKELQDSSTGKPKIRKNQFSEEKTETKNSSFLHKARHVFKQFEKKLSQGHSLEKQDIKDLLSQLQLVMTQLNHSSLSKENPLKQTIMVELADKMKRLSILSEQKKEMNPFFQELNQFLKQLEALEIKTEIPKIQEAPIHSKEAINPHHHEIKALNIETSKENVFQKLMPTQEHIDLKNSNVPISKNKGNENVNHSLRPSVQISPEIVQSTDLKGQSSHSSFKGGENFLLSHSNVNKEVFSPIQHTETPFEMTMKERLDLAKDIIHQLGENLKGYVGKNQTQLTLQLTPENLGKVKVMLNMKNDLISCHVLVENDVVKNLLQERLNEMKVMFQNNGIQFNQLNIQTQGEYFEQQHQNDQENLFIQHKESATQIKLNRLTSHSEKFSLPYEKINDNLYNDENFLVTV